MCACAHVRACMCVLACDCGTVSQSVLLGVQISEVPLHGNHSEPSGSLTFKCRTSEMIVA